VAQLKLCHSKQKKVLKIIGEKQVKKSKEKHQEDK
jgi:hypothetical protein